jgi:hypothetical protein
MKNATGYWMIMPLLQGGRILFFLFKNCSRIALKTA